MHTSEVLRPGSFEIEVGGRPAGLDALLPGFDERSRLGVVVLTPCGAAGASLLMLAAATAFYERRRSAGRPFEAFADHYVFHRERLLGDHAMLDVWPARKEVVVEGAWPEAFLEAIDDRAVTHLAVPDGWGPVDRDTPPYALAGARTRLVAALAYAPSGRVARADVRIGGDEQTEAWVRAAIEASPVTNQERRAALAARAQLSIGGRPFESYRRVPIPELLQMVDNKEQMVKDDAS